MRKMFLFAAFAAAMIAGAGNGLFAQRGTGSATGGGTTVEVILASPLPKNSPWGRTLDRIGVEWTRATNGQVRVRVSHDGKEGGEAQMNQRMKTNDIQAAVFTTFGLSAIHPAVMTMSAPFLIRTGSELNAVMNEVQDDLEAGLNSGDYFILAWSKSGFVNIFSKEPVIVPDDLRRLKIASNAEASEMNTAFTTMGFQVVETDWVDVGQKLLAPTGGVQAVYQNPAAVIAFQLYLPNVGNLRNMLSINIAPVLGGIVMNQVTWRKIGSLNPRYQEELLRITRRAAEEFDASLQRAESEAIQGMTRGGLKVNRPSPAEEQQWYSDVEQVVPRLLGTTYDRNLYQKIDAVLKRVRGGR